MPHTKNTWADLDPTKVLSAVRMTNLEKQYDDAMADAAALYGADVRPWAATTAYAAGQAVVSPSGDVVTAITGFTSGASYNSANWSLSATFEPAGLSAASKDSFTPAAKTIYVSTTGSDTNSGKTWATAKATIAAALTAAGSTGTVALGDGTFHTTSTLTLDRLNSIDGAGSTRTIISTDFDGVGILWQPSVFSGDPGGRLKGFTLVAGTGAADNAVGLQVSCVTKPHLDDVQVSSYSGANSIGVSFKNVQIGGVSYWTERIDARAVVVKSCTIGVCFDQGTGTNSFMYAQSLDFTVNTDAIASGTARTAFVVRGGAVLQGCNISFMTNVAGVNGANTIAPTALLITGSGSAILESLCNIRAEMTSGTAATSLSLQSSGKILSSVGVLAFLETAGFTPSIAAGTVFGFSGTIFGTNLGASLNGSTKGYQNQAMREPGAQVGFQVSRHTVSTSSPTFGLISHPSTINSHAFSDQDLAVISDDGTNKLAFMRFLHDPSGGPLVEFIQNMQTRGAVTGALSTASLTSGTAAQMAGRGDRQTCTPVTFSPTASVAATCKVELSPDGTTYSTLATYSQPANAIAGVVEMVPVFVPSGWRLRLTATNATLGATTYY